MKNTTVYTSQGDTYLIIETGTTIAEVFRAYKDLNYMVPHGSTQSIGFGGHVTGGGMGSLTRFFGFTSDRIMGVEIVLQDGQVARIFDSDHEEKLAAHKLPSCGNAIVDDKRILWAIKGSGHIGLGIVTKFYAQMLPKPKYVVHGIVSLPVQSVQDARQYFDIPCAYFQDARDERPGEQYNRLQSWATILPINDLLAGRLPSINYLLTYIAEADTEQAAWEEGFAEINGTFFKGVTAVPTFNTLQVKPYNDMFESLSNSPAATSQDGTCGSKVINHKNDVCKNETWLNEFSVWLHHTVQFENWQPYGNFPFVGLEKWGGRGSWADPYHTKGSMSTRHAWSAFEACFWRTNKSLPRTEIFDLASEFNEKHLLPISSTYYANYANFNVRSEEDLFPVASIRNRLRSLKHKYDPKNVFSKDGGEYSLSD